LYNKGTKRFKRFYTEDGLPDNAILSVIEDNAGDIWISTTKGYQISGSSGMRNPVIIRLILLITMNRTDFRGRSLLKELPLRPQEN
jgi:ligand-binding sensor domain-containing protein